MVVVDNDKEVEALRPPVPLELLAFGLEATLLELSGARVRAGAPATPDGGVLADLVAADLADPARVTAQLDAVAGVVSHGLFAPELVDEVLVGRGDDVERRAITGRCPGEAARVSRRPGADRAAD